MTITRKATMDDVVYLSSHLRGADIAEVLASTGMLDVQEALTACFRHSDFCEVGLDSENNPAIIYGMGLKGSSGVIWAVASRSIHKNKARFLKNCRQVIQKMFDEFPEVSILFNFSHGANTLHHRWLQWCGAELLPEVPHGVSGDLFRPFVIRRGNPLV